jgi:hypothetical protein
MTTKEQTIEMFELCLFGHCFTIQMDACLLVLRDGFNGKVTILCLFDGCMMGFDVNSTNFDIIFGLGVSFTNGAYLMVD